LKQDQREKWVTLVRSAGNEHFGGPEGPNLEFAKICGLHFSPEEMLKLKKGKNARDHLLPVIAKSEVNFDMK